MREGLVRGRRRTSADVVGVEGLSRVLGGPEPSRGLVRQRDGGLVVTQAFSEREGPAPGGIEVAPFRFGDLGRAECGAVNRPAFPGGWIV